MIGRIEEGKMANLIMAVRRHFEPVALGVVALVAILVAVGLIALSLLPVPVMPSATTARPASPPEQITAVSADKSVATVEKAVGSRGDEKSDVTLFRRVAVEIDGRKVDVVTGLIYATSAAPKPIRQFCYLSAGRLSALTEITMSLARKEGEGEVHPSPVEEKDAHAVGLPLSRIAEATGSCRFI
jgi:hypothetical protein